MLEGLERRQLFAATLTVTNPFILPGSDQVIFSKVGDPSAESPTQVVHSQQALTLTDTGSDPLTISSLSLSGPFAFVTAPTLPMTIAAGGTASVTIQFTQNTVPSHSANQTNYTDHTADGAAISGSLTIASNDTATPSRVVGLAGYFQQVGNNNEEPSLQTIINTLGGYQTDLGLTNGNVDLTEGSTPTYYGDEVASDYWARADTSQGVTVQQLAAYHTDGNTATLSYYPSSSSTTTHQLIKSTGDQAQTVLPATVDGGSTPLTATFYPASAFGLKVDTEFSTDSLNVTAGNSGGGGHHFRFFPVYDHTGTLVPNTYFVAMDYGQTQAENFDFQDNVYVVSNVRPASIPPTVSNLAATNATAPVLSWTASTYSPVGYNVYRSTTAGGTYTKLTATPITTNGYTDTSAPATGTVYYEVTAVDTSDATESPAATVAARPGPVVASFTLSAISGTAQTFNPLASATDTTGTIVPGTVTIVAGPSNGGSATVDPSTGYVTYTSLATYTGTETLSYTVADSNNVRSAAGTITFNVSTTPPSGTTGSTGPSGTTGTTGTGSTATPTLNPYIGQTLVNTAIVLPVLSTDTSGSAFSTTNSPVAVVTPAKHGTATAQPGGTVSYMPSASFVGGDSFTYQATNLAGKTSAAVTVDVNVGVSVGSTTTYKALTFTDADGTQVSVTLNRGLADVYFDGTGLYTAPTRGKTLTVSGGASNGLHIRTIGLSGTTAASALNIVGAKGGQVTFGGVTDAAPLGTLNAKTSNLTVNSTGASSQPVAGNAVPAGYVNLAGVRSLSLRSATSGTIDLGATGVASSAVSVATSATGTSLSSVVPISRLTAAAWIANSGTTPGPITAPTINALTVPGEFDADLTLTGPVARVPDLGTARVGTVNGGTWTIGGSARSVTIGTANAGYGGLTVGGGLNAFTVAKGNLGADTSAGLIGSFRVAGTLTGDVHSNGNLTVMTVGGISGSTVTVGNTDGFLTATAADIGTATLGTFRVTGRTTPVFNESVLIADHIGSVTTGQVNASSTNPEGIVATTIKSAAIGVDGGTVRLNSKELASNATVTAALSGKTLGTFVLEIL